MSTGLVIVLLVAAFGYGVWQSLRDDTRSATGPGIAPHPFVPVIDAGDARVLDLRGVPEDVLASGAGLAWGLEARRVLPPTGLCVWVVGDAVLDEWATTSELAWTILAARMKDQRKQPSPPAVDALYVPEGRFPEDALSRARAAGLMIAHDLEVIGAQGTVGLRQMLDAAPVAPRGERRPELGGSCHGLAMVTDYVWETADFVFVDLRRASLRALDSLAVFDHVDEALRACPRDKPLIWVFSPWVVDRWKDRRPEVAARLSASLGAFGAKDMQFAIDAKGADPRFLDALEELALRPVDGMLSVRTEDATFTVPVLDVLRDLQFRFAIPEETRRRYGIGTP